MILRKNTYYILTFVVIGFLFCNCGPKLKGWFIIPQNKNAKHYYTWYGDKKNISIDENMDIRFDVWASIINTGSYVSKSTDSIDVTLNIYIHRNQKYIPAPKVTIDEFTLIDIDKNDTLEVAYIRFNHRKNLHAFSEITPTFQEWSRNDSIEAAKEGFWREREYFYRWYDIDIRTNRQQKDVKNLLLNFQFTINYEQYKIMNCKYKVKEKSIRILPH
jgi:hypothetical protein